MMATILFIVINILAIGLGIPDSILGAAWPAISQELGIDVTMINCISVIVSGGTVLSSLISARVIEALGIAKVVAISTIMTAVSLLGFSVAYNVLFMCLLAVPLGLGAGTIDAAINNYVALHYKAMYMNLVHCIYGVGIMLSPYIMSIALDLHTWRFGYVSVAAIQGTIAVVSIVAMPLWGKVRSIETERSDINISTPGIRELMADPAICCTCVFFFASNSIEGSCSVWSCSYLVETKGFAASAAAGIIVAYYFGLTVGRLVSGVLTNRFSTWSIIRVGLITLLAGTVVIFVFDRSEIVVIGLFMIGAGVAPIFPGLIFLTPRNFGVEISQSVTGLEMAFAYCGSLASPVLTGLLLKTVSKQCFPIVLLCFILLAMVCNFGLSYLLKRGSGNQESDL